MGKTTGSYNAEYEVGSKVRIVGRDQLDLFMQNWKYHHPLQPFQLHYGRQEARVKDITFYHGGDELYELEGVPGIWHEECLSTVEVRDSQS